MNVVKPPCTSNDTTTTPSQIPTYTPSLAPSLKWESKYIVSVNDCGKTTGNIRCGTNFNQSEVDQLIVDMILAAVVNFRLLWGLFDPKGSFAGQIEMKQALLELSQLKEAVEGLGDDLEKYALLVDETDVWVCIQNIDPLLDLCTKN